MIQNDRQIRALVEQFDMIAPFEPGQIREHERNATQAEVIRMAGLDRAAAIASIGPACTHVRQDVMLGHQVRERQISYGLSSFGYDIRCADEFKVFTNIHSTVVDPKNFDDRCFVDFKQDHCIIPPNSFALARTVEYFRIPDDVMTVCLGKSTYARCGIIVNVTPFEPGFEGYVTLEFSNTTPLPAKIYAGEGCAQVLFFRGERPEVTYGDRGGKYQRQVGVTGPRM